MLFVALYSIKPNYSLTQSLQRRMEWKMPESTINYPLISATACIVGISR